MQAIGRLAGGVAHDFNNLLTVIINYAELAVAQLREGDSLRDDIEPILEAGERAAMLTRQLLAFSRRQVMEPRILDLNEVVTDLESMLRRLIGEDIELRAVLSDDLGRVNADPHQLEQVIMNLAVNARDAMPEGGQLTIETADVELDEHYASLRPATEAGRYVLLSVTDTGVGMTDEVKEHIFEPFFTTKETGQGTGLGLATVYGIVKQSHGNIWVYSEPGRGTTFKVYLPEVDAERDTPTEEIDTTRLVGTERVLVVEDEEAVRHLTERILRAAGYEVIGAASGPEALVQWERFGAGVNLVLTDVIMPQMSGRTLVDHLTQSRQNLKVLYMSGYTDNAIVHHGVLDEGRHFIAKPFTARDLLRKVRVVLDRD
jgi:CheY-like chemotaxis protein